MTWQIVRGDALTKLASFGADSVQTVVTSPPYWGLRDYGTVGQLGLEATPHEYVAYLVAVFREVRRVLRDDGTAWLNLGDSYADNANSRAADGNRSFRADRAAVAPAKRGLSAGLKPKDLVGIPWRVAFALQADGWWLRSDIIWSKSNPMPESVQDRPTRAHEYVFLLTKSARYFYDADAIREPHDRIEKYGFAADGLLPHEREGRTDERPRDRALIADGSMHGGGGFRTALNPAGRNRRSVWEIATQPYPEAHFATFPAKLVEPCILAGSSPKACVECGAPWERVVERSHDTTSDKSDSDFFGDGRDPGVHRKLGSAYQKQLDAAPPRTVGWNPTCSHGYERHDDVSDGGTAQCLVLDPFCGSGTTGMVALRHGRSFVGVELSPDYCELARRRIVDDAPLLNAHAELVPSAADGRTG